MAFWSKNLWEKHPGARVPDDEDPDAKWVDGAVVYDELFEANRMWDGVGAVSQAALRCSDRRDANLVRVEDRGWFAVTRAQARELADQLFD